MEINKNDLIEWFWEKFNSCYLVKHDDYPQSVFMFYDPQYIRKLKLANISGEKISSKTDVTGICLFEQDWKNKKFYCDSDEIWDHLYSNYSTKYDETQQFISDRLEEHSKLSVLTPNWFVSISTPLLEEHSKLSVLTPSVLYSDPAPVLEEHSKLSVLTPLNGGIVPFCWLEEHSKLSVLTPSPLSTLEEYMLEEHSKLSVLTPISISIHWLEEHSKLSVLTPPRNSGTIGSLC